jgi:hypothetical protein
MLVRIEGIVIEKARIVIIKAIIVKVVTLVRKVCIVKIKK